MTLSEESEAIKTLSILDLLAMKQANEKITCLTAYDASFSQLLDQENIDVMLVGDSLGMVIQGKKTTVPVSIDEMVYHTQCVVNARKRAFVIADLPFLTYATKNMALKNAAKLMQLAGAQMVKLEGSHLNTIKTLVNFGVPVCGNLGLLPKTFKNFGRIKLKGKNQQDGE
jgi:3-methyl-2-oxobutanoate hydroxymethyltransferase